MGVKEVWYRIFPRRITDANTWGVPENVARINELSKIPEEKLTREQRLELATLMAGRIKVESTKGGMQGGESKEG